MKRTSDLQSRKDTTTITADEMAEHASRVLSGQLIQLRETRQEDKEQLAEWWQDPASSFLIQPEPRPRALSTVVQMIESWSANVSSTPIGLSIVSVSDGELLGHATLVQTNISARTAEMSLFLNPSTTGRGYGADAVNVLLRFAFGDMNYNKVDLEVFEFNDRAVNCYERAGFTLEGRRRAAVRRVDRYFDVLCYGMLRSEFAAAQNTT